MLDDILSPQDFVAIMKDIKNKSPVIHLHHYKCRRFSRGDESDTESNEEDTNQSNINTFNTGSKQTHGGDIFGMNNAKKVLEFMLKFKLKCNAVNEQQQDNNNSKANVNELKF